MYSRLVCSKTSINGNKLCIGFFLSKSTHFFLDISNFSGHVFQSSPAFLSLFFFFYLNSISYNTSAVFSVSWSSSGCQSEQYRLVNIQ